ncbi:hypothetical protein ACFTY8_42095 [Streptomyces mirabilis]|uniref:hypothetical protein n=1 Tax=Streptomyces mirabilis TaxID=68239 RepID=UPI0036423B06
MNAFEQVTETVEEAAVDSGSAGEAADGDVASDFPTALAAAQNLGWEGRHQRVVGDLYWLQGQPERAAAAYLAGRTEGEQHGRVGEAAHSQALRAFAVALYAPDGATAEIDLAHQFLAGLNLRATTINVRRAELIRDAGSDIVDDQIATLRTEIDIAGLTSLTPAIELACAFHQAVLDDRTALHATLAGLREQTSDEDHAYFVDIAQFIADMPVDQTSGVRWLDSEQHTRRRWRGLVIARQTHPHAGPGAYPRETPPRPRRRGSGGVQRSDAGTRVQLGFQRQDRERLSRLHRVPGDRSSVGHRPVHASPVHRIHSMSRGEGDVFREPQGCRVLARARNLPFGSEHGEGGDDDTTGAT